MSKSYMLRYPVLFFTHLKVVLGGGVIQSVKKLCKSPFNNSLDLEQTNEHHEVIYIFDTFVYFIAIRSSLCVKYDRRFCKSNNV